MGAWNTASDVVTTVGGAVALVGGLVGGVFALVQFVHANRTRRAEWLASLHEQFFETDRYSRVRRVLDYPDEPQYIDLRAAVTTQRPHALADELYRYLNFFELLASLKELGQISTKEILSLFEYDLGMLRRHEFIVEALRPQGFEHLSELLGSFPERR